MERVQSDKSNGVAFGLNNFLYVRDNSHGEVYFACQKRLTHRCPGRVVWQQGLEPRVSHEHNHVAEERELLVLRLKEVLRARAASEGLMTLSQIFREEELRQREAAWTIGGFTSAVWRLYSAAGPKRHVAVSCLSFRRRNNCTNIPISAVIHFVSYKFKQ